MKKFKFNLQTVHKVRELKSEQENLVLSELQNEVVQAELRVAHIESMRAEAVERYMERLTSGDHLNPREMELSSNHFASLNSLQKEAQRSVDEKRQACLSQLDVVKARRIEVKVTDKLHDEERKRHQRAVDRDEQKNTDELVTANFARNLQKSK